MRKRTNAILVRFTSDELDALTRKAVKAGLPREAYCRAILNGSVVREAMTAEVPKLLRAMRTTGANLDQLLAKANSIGLLDVPQMRRDLDELRSAIDLIVTYYSVGER